MIEENPIRHDLNEMFKAQTDVNSIWHCRIELRD